MKLYRIRNKITDKYLHSQINPQNEGIWGKSGCFWKKIDTVKKHIDWLMHEWELSKTGRFTYAHKKKRYAKGREGIFEVVVSDITVNGEETIKAEDLVERDYV